MDSARANRIAKELVGASVGGWTILQLISHGKSALVLRAQKGTTTAAIKIFDPELIERYGREAQLDRIKRELQLRDKRHPNLVPILDGGECPATSHLFVVMALIEGRPLSEVIQDAPRDRIQKIIGQVAGAAKFLEDNGIAHRDIKPANIIVDTTFEHATLMDLGVVRPIAQAGPTDNEQRVFVGTLQYAPPEFLFRREEDTANGWRAVTFYQLGGVLHDLIMRVPLFNDFSNPYTRLVPAIQYENPPIHGNDVPPNLLFLAKNCLVKDPALRLAFVDWAHFNNTKSDPYSGLEAKERIRKRRLQAGLLSVINVDLAAEQRALRRLTEELRQKLLTQIRDESIASGEFPPMEVRELPLTSDSEAMSRINFAPTGELKERLTIWIKMTTLDIKSMALAIECAATLGNSETPPTDFDRVFQGVWDDSATRAPLSELLYLALDQAQQLCSVATIPLGHIKVKRGA